MVGLTSLLFIMSKTTPIKVPHLTTISIKNTESRNLRTEQNMCQNNKIALQDQEGSVFF